ncbi:MAG TPA: PhzF family phenazine biosynthesis protein [Deltaproteobacteria bacterium]|jgi:PhzF family phenazine biosynthesis protein|nr:PhzF family phenazine biosynthesis protein [Deltaproteobacteria bacterium]HQI00288.1 PhzF family phenazine biosynthesis protein [Deltaproteobacteria bacterium]HQJ10183.1 PhzF family phenazine biosynthesis protein [Deltaproteobacteria bacterium]
METPIYQVDAFTSTVFSGNPAAVCPLGEWLPDEVMQAIARENNLSETAFFVPEGDSYKIRWFTPEAEVDLCGHATLASAYVILKLLETSRTQVQFFSRSGLLTVSLEADLLAMNFPSQLPRPCEIPPMLVSGLGMEPSEILCSEDYFAVYESEDDIKRLEPDMNALCSIGMRGVIVTAPGRDADFVSRFFAPRLGIPEDPVTGSAHCALIPYWSRRLDKKELHARQISRRGGELFCRDLGDRVEISGCAALYMSGTINIWG